MMLARSLALLPLLVSAEACAQLGAHCSLWNSCCGSLHCKPHGLLNWRCTEECVAEGQTCGGQGLADKTCCGGKKCEHHLLGTSNKQCVTPQPQCEKQGQICGCTGCLTQQCCGGSTCSEVLGQGGKRYCVDARMGEVQALNTERNSTVLVQQQQQAECVAEGQTCGGPGLSDGTCCDGMKCEHHLLGTSNKQCVRPQPQCKKQGQICGCTGCLTQQCCGGSTCSEVLGQGGKRYCIDASMVGMGETKKTQDAAAKNETAPLLLP